MGFADTSYSYTVNSYPSTLLKLCSYVHLLYKSFPGMITIIKMDLFFVTRFNSLLSKLQYIQYIHFPKLFF